MSRHNAPTGEEDVEARSGLLDEGASEANAPPDEKDEVCGSSLALRWLLDVCLSIPFWYFMLFAEPPSVRDQLLVCAALIALMVVYRIGRMRSMTGVVSELPYTTGFLNVSGKDLYVVATLHISPRAPQDVHTVIQHVGPEVVMIEMDEERMDRLQEGRSGGAAQGPPREPPRPRPEDLQKLTLAWPGRESTTVLAQRALWNGEFAGERIAGNIVFDESNYYGLAASSRQNLKDAFLLVHRGGPQGEFAPFALKAINAAREGAIGTLVINSVDTLPRHRLGASNEDPMADLRVAWKTGTCGFPSIPLLMLEKKDGNEIEQAVRTGTPVRAELQVREDNYPRRTLRKRLCQGCALVFSGIGILYGVIQCFGIEVGAEFTAAWAAARQRGVPAALIDSNMNSFWDRLGRALIPTPRNLLDSCLAWLVFPRILFRVLFPHRTSVDTLGSAVLHAASFKLRTWLGFLLAGFAASFVTNQVLGLFVRGTEYAGEKAGAIKEQDRDSVQTYLLLLLELYMLPRIYEAVAACRDEVMYRSIVVQSHRHNARRLVVVVGAGHANGIMQKARSRGLLPRALTATGSPRE